MTSSKSHTGQKLNIGSGHTFLPDFVNIDIDPRADIVLDLSADALPFADNSVDLVFTHHTLEHIAGYLHAIGEIYRVLSHDGLLLVGVPYLSLTEYNLVNPYHRQHFNEHSFAFFDPERLRGSAAESDAPIFRELFLNLNYIDHWGKLPSVLRNWCRRHLFNTVRDMDIGLVAVKSPQPVDLSKERRNNALALYRDLLAARQPR